MAVPPQKHYSEAEYLDIERDAGYKSEYYNGEIFAMAGADHNHNRIVENLSIEIGGFFKGKSCRTFSSDQRIHIPETGLYTYPDLLIVCDKNQYLDNKKDTILNPAIIIEVLSESTEAHDRGQKFHFYRSISTLQEYVLINSRSYAAEVFRKNEEGFWVLASEAYNLNDRLEMKSVGLTLAMTDIYAQTEDLN
ncbi:Uma2 family endonuclease [Dyadobacter subterraneus]|uniref:Uma2 family endonuclease n=1 Tax=Dyadobacter subterraneus TaxID=2773304 RepID=A0ABR9W5Q4_9BACT|nr:Uma2 family endonuclease [Dyadobacter subterraneus]MBE9460778.1 Uma2 family endonuclease [Dyadobacter subterraneus]